MKKEIEKMIEKMKERRLTNFLNRLEELAFIKSTNSITSKEEELNPIIEDREATIKICAEFDREDLKNLIIGISG